MGETGRFLTGWCKTDGGRQARSAGTARGAWLMAEVTSIFWFQHLMFAFLGTHYKTMWVWHWYEQAVNAFGKWAVDIYLLGCKFGMLTIHDIQDDIQTHTNDSEQTTTTASASVSSVLTTPKTLSRSQRSPPGHGAPRTMQAAPPAATLPGTHGSCPPHRARHAHP